MATLCDLSFDAQWTDEDKHPLVCLGRFNERLDVMAYLHKVAESETSDFEHKMNKIIKAIERGEHEEA